MNKKTVQGYFLAGLLVWLPLWATYMFIRFVVNLLDNTLALIPKAYQPDVLIGWHLPGVGVIVAILMVFITGILVTNYFGHKLIHYGERLLDKIPLVRTIYTAVKQVVETIFSSNSQSFRKVLLIQYPRKGIWTIGFQTGGNIHEIDEKSGEPCHVVFIPTTPNPTSGFIMMIPKDEIIELEMSVDEALKMIISLGVVQPNGNQIQQKKG